MKRTVKMIALLLALLMLLCACGSEKPADSPTSAAAFAPRLDTQKTVELECAVSFGNFEAFDQVINHFNAFYPNVKVSYYQSFSHVPDFIENNPNVDIFMTTTEKGYPTEACVDLVSAGVDVSAVVPGLLSGTTVDGKVLSIPMGLLLKGLVVNKTLLEKEGLSVPETWPEFLSALEMLKQKGYTPIQGPNNAVATLCYDMAMPLIADDQKLYDAVRSGDAAGASAVKAAFEHLQELVDKGYIDPELNAEYPENNYDGAILKFFEGDVPFWVCDTEKVSGMKKRESKSEAFSANPFSYEFIFAPLGDTGVYEFIVPWYGFAVYKNSEVYDYAVEFLRFLAQKSELDTLASVKGVPAVTSTASDERYVHLGSVKQVEKSVVDDGSVYRFIGTFLENEATDLLNGTVDVDEAMNNFLSHSAESAKGMTN